MIKFKDDEFLGKTVKNTRIYCSIGVDKIKSIEQLRVAGGGSKFSSLCGFMFDSANEGTEFPRFMISFVCKLRSRIYRQQKTNPSKWFIFRKISNKRVDVLDKKAALVNYGFDVDKFFDSDMFKKCLPKFEAVLKKGLDDAKVFAESQENNTVKSEAERYIHSITESIPLMLKSTELNDKYYQLNNLDALEKAASDGISDEIKRKALDAKLAAISKGNKAFMDKVAANQRDVEYKRSEESEDVDEAKNPDDYKCKVQKKKEGGKEVWEVCELDGHWVATFHDEVAAKAFADDYPKLKADYLDKAAEFSVESEKTSVNEAEKIYTLKMLLEDLNGFIETDAEWNTAPVYIELENGDMYGLELTGLGTDVECVLLSAGKKIKIKKAVKKPTKNYESAEKLDDVAEKELDADIEESLKEIYK